jgi:hypothetical protein
MKMPLATRSFAVLALLVSSAGMAATVTIVPSTLTPVVGENFTLTVQADVGNTFAATMALSFDATRVSFVGGVMPDSGPFSVANGGAFIKNSATTENPTVFHTLTASASRTAANPGTYDAAILTFTVLASGAASIWINDDGGWCCGWFDADSAEYIPVTYVQTNVVGAEPSLVPVPAALWLFGSALGIMSWLRRKVSTSLLPSRWL